MGTFALCVPQAGESGVPNSIQEIAVIRLCHNVIPSLCSGQALSVSEGSRLLNYQRDSSVALFPQNDKMVILRDCDTV